jgi:hypothetical protein
MSMWDSRLRPSAEPKPGFPLRRPTSSFVNLSALGGYSFSNQKSTIGPKRKWRKPKGRATNFSLLSEYRIEGS